MTTERKPPLLFIGLFFGLLIGVILTVVLSTESDTESYRSYQERTARQEGRPPPMERQPQGGGERERPEPPAEGHGQGGEDRAMQSMAKVHFMKKFVAALVTKPENAHPSASWTPLVKDPASPIRCSDCHDPNKIDVERMMSNDPGNDAVAPFRRKPMFMIPLMTKWVEKLNRLHAGRLRKEITCTDCHAIDPREKNEVYPYLMQRFVRALSDRPTTNKEPSSRWKPLLKEPAAGAVRCSTCHTGPTGPVMDKNFLQGDLPRPTKYVDDHALMVEIMDDWVETLNRTAGDSLTKVVECSDCHETDPRRK